MAVRTHNLRPPKGARRRRRRVGRGDASGHGSYSGRGIKGQKARGGKPPRPGFEGGQLPLVQRLPKQRGFVNPFRREYTLVKLGDLDARFEAGAVVDILAMARAGLVRDLDLPVKVLSNGGIRKPLTVIAHRFSAKAKEQVLAAGGQVQELEPPRREEG